MHFRIKHILLFISILGINLILGQGYFSTFFPVNNFSMDARSMAMGGANFGSMQNPAFGSFGKPFMFRLTYQEDHTQRSDLFLLSICLMML